MITPHIETSFPNIISIPTCITIPFLLIGRENFSLYFTEIEVVDQFPLAYVIQNNFVSVVCAEY